MTFSDLLKLFYRYFGHGQKHATFVSDFIYLLMGASERIDSTSSGNPYPYHMHSDSFSDPKYNICNKLFKGTSEISQNNASRILFYYRKNKDPFIEELTDLEEDEKDDLQAELEAYGVSFDDANFVDTVTDLVEQILYSYSTTGKGCNFSHLPTRDILGNKQKGIPLTSVIIHNGKLYVGGVHLDISEKLNVPDEIDTLVEGKYVNAILEAYTDALNCKQITLERIDVLKPSLKKHFMSQRMNFYEAEYLRRLSREILEDGDKQFELLEDDIEAGIEPIIQLKDGNGFDRMQAAIDRSTTLQLTGSDLCNIRNAIGIRTRQGMCHELVNDGRIETWVKKDE